MIPASLTGLYILKDGKINFYSASIKHDRINNVYILSEKEGESGVYFKEHITQFLTYQSIYNYMDKQINYRMRIGYVQDPANACELRN